MLHHLRAPLAIGLLFLSTGASGNGCIANADIEVKSVCVTRTGVGLGPTDGAGATARFMLDDFGTIGALAAQDGEMQFTQIVIRPTQGMFGSIATARAAISSGDPSSSLPTLEATCAGNCLDADGAIQMPTGAESDAVAYVSSGSMVIELAVTGELPTEPWTVDVDVCMLGQFAAGI